MDEKRDHDSPSQLAITLSHLPIHPGDFDSEFKSVPPPSEEPRPLLSFDFTKDPHYQNQQRALRLEEGPGRPERDSLRRSYF